MRLPDEITAPDARRLLESELPSTAAGPPPRPPRASGIPDFLRRPPAVAAPREEPEPAEPSPPLADWAASLAQVVEAARQRLDRLTREAARRADAAWGWKTAGAVLAVAAGLAAAWLAHSGTPEREVKWFAALMAGGGGVLTFFSDQLARVGAGGAGPAVSRLLDLRAQTEVVGQRLARPHPPLTEAELRKGFDEMDKVAGQLLAFGSV